MRRERSLPEPGIYLLHKLAGPTSFSLVQQFIAEAAARGRKVPVCHGGALDPFARGLLLMLVGRATRLFDLLHPIPKQYELRVAWGAETDNGDPLGQVVAHGDASTLTPQRLDEAMAAFVGWREQIPPATSNKRIGGERAYARAHRGEQVDLPAVRVYLHEARWIAHDLPASSQLRLIVRGGYYVRSLVRDLGRALGCRAHVAALVRTAIGPWQDPGPSGTELISGARLLPWLRARSVDAREARTLRRGGSVPAGALHAPGWPLPSGFPEPEPLVRALLDGRVVALLRESAGTLTPVVYLGGI
jgi:tRNA pseudouridine55 synthase